MDNHKRWLVEFSLIVSFSVIFAGISYYTQFVVIGSIENDSYSVIGHFIRMSRMIIGYILPVLWFAKKYDIKLGDLGIKLSLPLFGTSAGIFIYIIAGIVFVENNIFTGPWAHQPIKYVIVNLTIIGVMASITDFWTRGFVLFQLEKRYGDIVAITGQNLLWFGLHFYEILLLVPYIGWIGSISLTIFLGITGDLIALKSRNIMGLMAGHVILNIMVMLGGKGIL